MAGAYLVAAVRTPVGRRGGGLSTVHPVDLGATVVRALVDRAGVDSAAIEDVIFGCVSQVGAQTFNVARGVVLSAGLPESVPGVTVDRQCGSSQQALHFAAQAVRSGDMDLVVAGGVEVMSLIPLGVTATLGQEAGMGHPRSGNGWRDRYGDQPISQFRGAELIAQRWGIDRTEMEQFAVESHRRAVAAAARGEFAEEIVPCHGVEADQCPRPDTSLAKMAQLPPLQDGGRITAALSSPISDGASAVLIASEAAVRSHDLMPLAKVHTTAVVGADPVFMLTGPIPATTRVLERAGLALSDIDFFEVNEAFASVVLAWAQETGASLEKTNVLGGALALGHPVGASGTRLATTLVHHLRRTGARYGLQVMCEGGGMANATIYERV